jgi:hypothetical protein
MREFSWSESETKAARKAFDVAYGRESAALIENVKRLAASAAGIDDIGSLHDYLDEQRQATDAKYDYRYSQLIFVFGRLLREKWLEDEDLERLSPDKLEAIRRIASF